MNRRAIRAAQDDQAMNDFLHENESFIMRCAFFAVHRFISKSDDEWSIALLAFSQAVKEYSDDKGNFKQFAKLVIRRRLIDYIRSQSKYNAETSVNPSVLDSELDSENDENSTDLEVKTAVFQEIQQGPDDSLKMEIQSANQMFSHYGFSFFDLTECSPKAEKTKRACAKAVAYIIKNPILVGEMKSSKLLPLKIIEKNCGVPRKILERHRKYIIAAVEIITGDYPFLADYLRFIREELNK
jgi:RNA polymerase sigma factor